MGDKAKKAKGDWSMQVQVVVQSKRALPQPGWQTAFDA